MFLVDQLILLAGVLMLIVAMIARGRTLVAPRGSTELRPGDHLFVIARADTRAEIDRLFGGG